MTLRDAFLIRPDVIFLNHGSFGACPRPVFDAYQAWQREVELQPVEFLSRRAVALLHSARAALAAYIGAGTDDLVFVPNTTIGLNTVARALPLQPGDEVLATDHEYGALDRTWQFVCERRGARYVKQPIPTPFKTAEAVVEALWAGVTPRTRVVFVSHITSPTAVRLPVEQVARRAREAGIWSVFDGAHAPGQVPIDLRQIDPDFYVGNAHKWLCSPKGSAFLYARPDCQPLLTPLVVSWGRRSELSNNSPFIADHEGQGTRDIAAFLAVPTAIEFLRQHDWPSVQYTCHEMLAWTRQAIGELTGLAPLTPDLPEWYVQMASFPLPPCDPAALKRRLYDDYAIEVPIVTWQDRQFVRVSVQGYNTWSDLKTLVGALTTLLPEASG